MHSSEHSASIGSCRRDDHDQQRRSLLQVQTSSEVQMPAICRIVVEPDIARDTKSGGVQASVENAVASVRASGSGRKG